MLLDAFIMELHNTKVQLLPSSSCFAELAAADNNTLRCLRVTVCAFVEELHGATEATPRCVSQLPR